MSMVAILDLCKLVEYHDAAALAPPIELIKVPWSTIVQSFMFVSQIG